MIGNIGLIREEQNQIYRKRKQLSDLTEEVSQLDKKIHRMEQIISNGWFETSTSESIFSNRQFIDITQNSFLLNSFIRCFISSEEFNRLKNVFITRFENLTDTEFYYIANRLAHFILLMTLARQDELIKRFLNLVSITRVVEATQIVLYPDNFHQTLLIRIQADASIIPLLTKCTPSIGFRNDVSKILRICIEDIDNFLKSFDILTSTPITGSDAQSYYLAYQMAISAFQEAMKCLPTNFLKDFLTDSPILATCLSFSSPFFSIGLPFLLMAIRKLYIENLKKTPSALPPLTEFTNPNFYQFVAPVNNRTDILDKIKHCWEAGITPILVGEPGCGKTSLLIEVARRIHRGQFGLPGTVCKAFGGSAVALASAGGMFGGSDHIRRTLKSISDKSEHAVLLLDEVEAFDQNQKMILRDFFGGGSRPIRYAVLATTATGKEEFFKDDDGSLERRFEAIHVRNFNEDETKIILQNQAQSMAPKLIVSQQVINRIVERSKGNLTQSRKLLVHVITKANKQNNSCPSQEELNRIESKLGAAQLKYQTQSWLDSKEATIPAQELVQLIKEKSAMEERLASEKGKVQHHCLLLAKREQLAYKIIEVSQAILHMFQEELTSRRRQLDQLSTEDARGYFTEKAFQTKIAPKVKEYAYYSFWMQPYLSERIREFEREHHRISKITDDYITDADLQLQI